MRREGIIIGAGASGLAAAVAAAEAGASVTLLEHMAGVGKKLLSTGNGKCNLTNLHLMADCYHCRDGEFAMEVLKTMPPEAVLAFFRRLGIVTTEKNGYVYPASGQAKTVLRALKGRVDDLGVRTVLECKVHSVTKKGTGFTVNTDQGRFDGWFVILAAGSMAAPSTGSDGSGYALARSLGHRIKKPLPALVQLRCGGDFFRQVAGVRTEACVSLYTVGKAGELETFLASDRGELQLTDYGISGIPVFQVSRYASIALDRCKRVAAVVDFFPLASVEEFETLLKEQRTLLPKRRAAVFLDGMFHEKLAVLFLKAAQIKPDQLVESITDRRLSGLCQVIRHAVFMVEGTNPFDKAQVCTGGVRLGEVKRETLESKLVPGLYFAGEILDVDGICGGYNLQWAWASGCLAGKSAAKGEANT